MSSVETSRSAPQSTLPPCTHCSNVQQVSRESVNDFSLVLGHTVSLVATSILSNRLLTVMGNQIPKFYRTSVTIEACSLLALGFSGLLATYALGKGLFNREINTARTQFLAHSKNASSESTQSAHPLTSIVNKILSAHSLRVGVHTGLVIGAASYVCKASVWRAFSDLILWKKSVIGFIAFQCLPLPCVFIWIWYRSIPNVYMTAHIFSEAAKTAKECKNLEGKLFNTFYTYLMHATLKRIMRVHDEANIEQTWNSWLLVNNIITSVEKGGLSETDLIINFAPLYRLISSFFPAYRNKLISNLCAAVVLSQDGVLATFNEIPESDRYLFIRQAFSAFLDYSAEDQTKHRTVLKNLVDHFETHVLGGTTRSDSLSMRMKMLYTILESNEAYKTWSLSDISSGIRDLVAANSSLQLDFTYVWNYPLPADTENPFKCSLQEAYQKSLVFFFIQDEVFDANKIQNLLVSLSNPDKKAFALTMLRALKQQDFISQYPDRARVVINGIGSPGMPSLGTSPNLPALVELLIARWEEIL